MGAGQREYGYEHQRGLHSGKRNRAQKHEGSYRNDPAISRRLLAVLGVSALMSVPSRVMDMGRRCCAFDELSPFGQDKLGAH
jgi:hypothetical protein